MGMIHDTEDLKTKNLIVENRRESVIIMDRERKYPHDLTEEERKRRPWGRSEHFFFSGQEGEFEMSKEFLLELITVFDNKQFREEVFGDYTKVYVR